MKLQKLKLTTHLLKVEFHRIHKALLLNSGEKFADLIEDVPLPQLHQLSGDVIGLPEIGSKTIKHFINYLYTKAIPTLDPVDTPEAKIDKTKERICLYAFAEEYEVHTDFRNKIADEVQDGFLAIESISRSGIISHIYNATQLNSKIRRLAAFFLLHHLRSPGYTDDQSLVTFLDQNKEARDDFVDAVRFFEPGQDPRIRDCSGDAKCLECYHEPRYLEGKVGVHPCQFHVHECIGDFKGIKLKEIDGVHVYEDDGDEGEPQHEPCHLFMP